MVWGSRHRARPSTNIPAARFLPVVSHHSHGLGRMFGIVGECDFVADKRVVRDTEDYCCRDRLDDRCDASRLFWRVKYQKKLAEELSAELLLTWQVC